MLWLLRCVGAHVGGAIVDRPCVRGWPDRRPPRPCVANAAAERTVSRSTRPSAAVAPTWTARPEASRVRSW